MILPALNKYIDQLDRLGDYLTSRCHQPLAMKVFVKALAVLVLLKTVMLHGIIADIVAYHHPDLPQSGLGRLLLSPVIFAFSHPDVFIGLIAVSCLVILIARPNYFLNAWLFIIELNLYVLLIPVADGSDLVLLTMTFIGFPLVPSRSEKANFNRVTVVRTALFNLARIVGMIQILLIYFVSGTDKLLSKTWQTGEAFEYIQNLSRIYNSSLFPVIQSPLWNIALSWITILYELIFCVMILAGRYRIATVSVGILFHLVIWFALSLPDFALVMIVSLLIFLKDEDYQYVGKKIRPSPL